MNNTAIFEAVSATVAKYGMTAQQASGGGVNVYDKKNRLSGVVSADGAVEQKRIGQQALMGALVRDAIKAAIKAMAA